MSFRTVTDYFDVAGTSIIVVSSDENKSSTTIEARDEKGDVIAQEIVGVTSNPSCSYVIKADASLSSINIGEAIGTTSTKYTITNVSITTGAGLPPSLTVSGEGVPSSSHTDCYYTIPTATLKACHHAQILWSCVGTTFGTGIYLTQANYTASGSLTKATKDGDTIAYDISQGKMEAQLSFVSTSGTAPTITAGSGWTITSPLTKSEPDSDYVQYSVTLSKPLAHHTTQTTT